MKNPNIVKLYEQLLPPFGFTTKEIKDIWNASATSALEYLKEVQNFAIEKGYYVSDKRRISNKWLLEYEGWDFEEIERAAKYHLAKLNSKIG